MQRQGWFGTLVIGTLTMAGCVGGQITEGEDRTETEFQSVLKLPSQRLCDAPMLRVAIELPWELSSTDTKAPRPV